jgi:K+-transporting ATPase KdpF subunit
MNPLYIVGLVITILLAIYLFVALFRAEEF